MHAYLFFLLWLVWPVLVEGSDPDKEEGPRVPLFSADRHWQPYCSSIAVPSCIALLLFLVLNDIYTLIFIYVYIYMYLFIRAPFVFLLLFIFWDMWAAPVFTCLRVYVTGASERPAVYNLLKR